MATTNAGTDRDVYFQATIYNNNSAWLSEDPNQIYYDSPEIYAVRVTSAFSPGNLPSFPAVNPYVGSGKNPQPLETFVPGNGSTSTLLQFAVLNGPYDSLNGQNGIDEFNFRVNRTLTESALIQDNSNSCQFNIYLSIGGAFKSYFLRLRDDSGLGDVGFLSGSLPETGSGSLQNSQCRVAIETGQGTYAQTLAGDNRVLGFAFRVTFFPSFSGERHIFMKSDRVNNAWTGWQYRGALNVQ